MTIFEFLLLVLIAAITGSIGMALAGYSRGGCLAAAVVGWLGAFIGLWIARQLALPELLTVQIDGQAFPVVWSIIGSMIFSLVLGLIFRQQYPHRGSA